MLKLIKYIQKKDYLWAIISFALIAFQVWLELKIPDYMSEITTLVQNEGSKMSDILTNGLYMIICALASLGCAFITGYLIANIAARFSFNVRKAIFDKTLNLSSAEVKEFAVSSLITRTTNDITQIQMFISMGLQLLIKAPLTAIWAITKILNKNLIWSGLTALAIIIILLAFSVIMIIVLPRFKLVQKLVDRLNSITRESLNGIRVTRAFNAEKYQENKFEKANDNLTNMQLFNQKTFNILSPLMYLVMHTLSLSIYIVGANLIRNTILSSKIGLFSNMVVFSSYALQVIMSFLMLAVIFMMMPRANVSAQRINEVLTKDASIKNGAYKEKTSLKGVVEFKNVYFKYPDAEEYLLEDISFKAEKGQTIAFIGSTGSGKSTLINLIPRFYDATKGEVLVDGVNVKDYDLEYLYNKLGYVSQKAVIFNNSVKENIKFGKSENQKTNNDIQKAMDISQTKEFVEKMDEKENTNISAGGTNISGGQKQRISIARAIARKPEIYIFDDSFSALDYKTDATLRKKLKSEMKETTSLIVAQRIGTIMNADKIVVLDDGKCVGIGTHKELLKNCEVYKQIALSQLSGKELENA